MAIIGLLAPLLMAVKNEYLTYEDTYKGIHENEKNLFVTGGLSFRHFCPLFCVVLFCL